MSRGATELTRLRQEIAALRNELIRYELSKDQRIVLAARTWAKRRAAMHRTPSAYTRLHFHHATDALVDAVGEVGQIDD